MGKDAFVYKLAQNPMNEIFARLVGLWRMRKFHSKGIMKTREVC